MNRAAIVLFISTSSWALECPQWTIQEASQNIRQLESQIQYHDNLYFSLHTSEISDSEYDQLKNQLTQLQKCFPSLAATSSAPHNAKGEIQWHQAYMGSLKKAHSIEDIKKFIVQAGKETILLQPKIDGIAIELVYDQGLLKAASTRGDGKRGLNIIQQIQVIPAIPKQTGTQQTIILHGELFARLDLLKGDLDGYITARHYVSGHISRAKIDTAAMEKLDFYPWLWVNSPYQSEQESIKKLSQLGFSWTTSSTVVVNSVNDIQAHRDRFSRSSEPLPFLTDGIVIKIDNFSIRKKWGGSQKVPSWALAWKFPAKTAISNITAVNFNIGRTGKITPVIRLEPVQLNNRIISSVSLGSINVLDKHELAIGDTIRIKLQGEAIPIFDRVVHHTPSPKQPIEPPPEKYNHFTCLTVTEQCQQQFIERLLWMVGKNGLNLPHFQPKAVQKLIESGNIHSLTDIFSLSTNDLIKAGVDRTNAKALHLALKNAFKLPFKQRLKALSLPHTGEERINRLIQQYSNFYALRRASSKSLSQALSSSEALAIDLLYFMALPEISQLIDILEGELTINH